MRLCPNCVPLTILSLLATSLPVFAMPPVGSREPQAVTDQSKLQQVALARKQAAEKIIHQEGEILAKEAQRIVTLRRSLETRLASLQRRVEDHNRNAPDRTNYNAVVEYNGRAERLNREKADLEAEVRSFDAARGRLMERGRELERRLAEVREKR